MNNYAIPMAAQEPVPERLVFAIPIAVGLDMML